MQEIIEYEVPEKVKVDSGIHKGQSWVCTF